MALGSGVCFGTIGVFSKLFYDHGGHAFDLAVIRMVGGAAVMVVIVCARRRPRPPRRLVIIALSFGVLVGVYNFALLEGYSRAPVPLIVVLYYIYPLLVTIGASLVFGEPFGFQRAIVISLGIAGIALIVGLPHSVPLLGIVMGLGAGVCAAGFVLGSRYLLSEGLPPVEMLTLYLTGPAVVSMVIAVLKGFPVPSGSAIGWAVCLVLISSVAGPMLFYAAVDRVGASTTSLLASTEPLVTVFLPSSFSDSP